jgi:NAD(P)-dependent dehydrogenase (short-subunit alcohol dehydrogenase family)
VAAEVDRSEVPDYAALGRLDGRRFVVLGGGNGIGRQVCHALAQAGADVVCVDRSPELAEAVAAEIEGEALVADVTRRDDLESVLARGKVSGLVDIVGMPVLGPLAELNDEDWERQFDLVLRHGFLAMQIGGRAIAAAGGGAMVFVGSISGLAHVPGQAAYGAAKAALHQLVASMGRELAPAGVRVNAVAPGFTQTPRLLMILSNEQWAQVSSIIPRGAPGSPAEIAAAVLFLASDLSSYVTGQVLAVDGGMTGQVIVPPLWPT